MQKAEAIEIRRCANGYLARVVVPGYKHLPLAEEFCFVSVDQLLGWIRTQFEPKTADPRQLQLAGRPRE